MVSTAPPANPYHPLADTADELAIAAFVGRERAFEHLYRQLTDPTQTGVAVIVGRRDIGKTALLLRFDQAFDETFIGVWLPLTAELLADESTWLLGLSRAANRALLERGYTLSRLPESPQEGQNPRLWFEEGYLPELEHIIRYRRLVFLLDNAGALVNAVHNVHLPADSFEFLRRLIGRYGHLGFVFTLDTRYETTLSQLSPLVALDSVFRLTNLSTQDSALLLRQPVDGLYTITDDGVTAIYRATGGQPRLLQRYGFHLFRLWEARHSPLFTAYEVKQLTHMISSQSDDDLKVQWSEASRNERLVLTAITSLLYDDPLAAIDTGAVATWLVETDYPLDSTAINAALRSLEYRELIAQTSGKIMVTAGLMQTWLLNNARLSESSAGLRPRRHVIWLALAVLMIIVVVLVFIANQRAAPPVSDLRPQPTVTLVTNP